MKVKKPRGRKRPAYSEPSVIISLRIPQSMVKLIEDMAKFEGVTTSDMKKLLMERGMRSSRGRLERAIAKLVKAKEVNDG